VGETSEKLVFGLVCEIRVLWYTKHERWELDRCVCFSGMDQWTVTGWEN